MYKVKGQGLSARCEFFMVVERQIEKTVVLDFLLRKGKVMNFMSFCSEVYLRMKKDCGVKV